MTWKEVAIFAAISTMASSVAAAQDAKAGGHDASTGSLLYYGWFFDAQIASSLKTIYTNNLTTLYTNVPAVQEFLKTVSEANNVTNPLSYFAKPADPATGGADPYYHITAMYCGGGIDCSDYTARVSPHLDQPFEMQLIGIFFTERTFGVRILLTPEQQELMVEDARNSARRRMMPRSTREEYPGIEFRDQEQNFRPTQSKAHITLGCAPGIPAHITGPDFLGVVAYENQTPSNYEESDLEGMGVLRKYFGSSGPGGPTNETAFVFYPNQRIVTTAKFEAYYMPPSRSGVMLLSDKVCLSILFLWMMYVYINS